MGHNSIGHNYIGMYQANGCRSIVGRTRCVPSLPARGWAGGTEWQQHRDVRPHHHHAGARTVVVRRPIAHITMAYIVMAHITMAHRVELNAVTGDELAAMPALI